MTENQKRKTKEWRREEKTNQVVSCQLGIEIVRVIGPVTKRPMPASTWHALFTKDGLALNPETGWAISPYHQEKTGATLWHKWPKKETLEEKIQKKKSKAKKKHWTSTAKEIGQHMNEFAHNPLFFSIFKCLVQYALPSSQLLAWCAMRVKDELQKPCGRALQLAAEALQLLLRDEISCQEIPQIAKDRLFTIEKPTK